MKKRMSISMALMFVTAVYSSAQAEDNTVTTALDEVVVTATKTEEKLRDVPNSVIIKDFIDIEKSAANSVGELLANEPGIDWRTYGDYGGASEALQLRGMDADETQVLVNGVPINSPSLGSANVANIPLNSIERIEVIKGAGSLLYGSGAMAGTINITTKSPQRNIPTFKTQAGYGSDATYKLSAEHGMFVGDVGYYITANHKGTDGERDNSKLNHNDVTLKLLYDKDELLSVSVYGQYMNRDFDKPGINPPDTSAPPNISYPFYNTEVASLVDYGEIDDRYLIFEIDSNPLKWLKVNVQTDFTDLESYDYMRYNYSGTGLETWVRNEVWGGEVNVELIPRKEFSLLVGTDYHNHDWSNKSIDLDTSGNKTSSFSNKAQIHTKSSYTEAQFRPSKQFKFLAGIRHETHSTFGNINLPQYGIIYSPNDMTNIKINNGKHFKAPTPNDLFWPETAFVRGNPNLDPQQGWHTDFTVEKILLDNKLMLTASYFDWDVKDKITWAPNPAFGNKWTPTNLNNSEGQGWEIGFQYNPSTKLSVSADYTYTDAEDTVQTGTRKAQHLARNKAKLNLLYHWDFGLIASATIRYTGERDYYRSLSDLNTTDKIDSYITTDIKLEQSLYDNWKLALTVNNLFNKDYDTYVGNFSDSTYGATYTYEYGRYPGAGLSAFFSIIYEY